MRAFRRRRGGLGADLDAADADLHRRCGWHRQRGAAGGMGHGRSGALGDRQARRQRQGLRRASVSPVVFATGRVRRGVGVALASGAIGMRRAVLAGDSGSGRARRAAIGAAACVFAVRSGARLRGRNNRQWAQGRRRRQRGRRRRNGLWRGRGHAVATRRSPSHGFGGGVVAMDFARMHNARRAIGQGRRRRSRHGIVNRSERRLCLAAFEQTGPAPPQRRLRGAVRALQQALQEAAHGCTRSR